MSHIAKIVMLARHQMTTTFFLSLFVAIIGSPFLMILIRRNQESLQGARNSLGGFILVPFGRSFSYYTPKG
jgi:hypothetical protein